MHHNYVIIGKLLYITKVWEGKREAGLLFNCKDREKNREKQLVTEAEIYGSPPKCFYVDIFKLMSDIRKLNCMRFFPSFLSNFILTEKKRCSVCKMYYFKKLL